jgi:hypothetical protein
MDQVVITVSVGIATEISLVVKAGVPGLEPE